ncbi:MAG: cysteine desulfurase / selenocysteine lyase [Frankiaceae bacterium]|jgi:cysteine desulfurase/selenocysteine lyase|nr:cysteine desulfurase / selenocysteine lyase [Frankiaceae bacterium]
MTLDTARLRKDFPILSREVHGRPLVYLDSAASSQRPQAVLDAMTEYYERHHANVHRGIYVLAEEATALYEGARDSVASFVNAYDRSEVVFTKNSTEALNLVARSLGDSGRVKAGDEIVVTEMEHHSNIVPWQQLAQRTGATLRWLGLTDDGRLDLSDLDDVVTERTRVVSFVHQSNILGTVNPVAPIVARAHEVGALVCLDASQSVPHSPVDVRDLGVDLMAFTGHKMLGPTGIGVLWGRRAVLDALPPFLGGGEMIETVTMAGSTYAEAPHKFEAGTPNIAEAVGLAAAIEYLNDVGMAEVKAHEEALVAYALPALESVAGLRILGPRTPDARGGAISFALADLHPHDVGQVLDELGIAVRVGQHCAAPVCARYGVPATTRASFHLYTTTDEVDALVAGLEHVKRFFRAA